MADSTSTPHPEDPRKPDSPTDLELPTWWFIVRSTVREFLADGVTDSAAGLTFYAVLSVFPAAIALVSIFDLVGQDPAALQELLDELAAILPADQVAGIQEVLGVLLGSPSAGLGLVMGLVVAMWTASRYTKAFGRAMNTIYEVPEGRNIVVYYAQMYLVTAAMLLLAAGSVMIVVLSGPVAETLGRLLGLGSFGLTVWTTAKWPVLALMVVVLVAILYYFTPNVRQPRFRWISVGAVVAIVVGALASVGLGVYLRLADLTATYGALTGAIVFLLWMWIMNIALLLGAELDAELERARQLEGGIAAEEGIQLPPRSTRASDKRAESFAQDVAEGRAIRENVVDARRDDAGDPTPRFRRHAPEAAGGRRYGSSAVAPGEAGTTAGGDTAAPVATPDDERQ